MDDNVNKIWQSVLSGNSDAWKELVTKFTPLLMAVARRSGLNQADMDDCVQQTWLTLYRNRDTILDPNKVKTWLTSVVQRKAVRIFRQKVRLERRYSQMEPLPPSKLPDEDLLNLERSIMLQRGIYKLGPQCQRVLKEVFYSPVNLSYKDIAKKLGISVNSLGPIRFRCLKKLKEILKRIGF